MKIPCHDKSNSMRFGVTQKVSTTTTWLAILLLCAQGSRHSVTCFSITSLNTRRIGGFLHQRSRHHSSAASSTTRRWIAPNTLDDKQSSSSIDSDLSSSSTTSNFFPWLTADSQSSMPNQLEFMDTPNYTPPHRSTNKLFADKGIRILPILAGVGLGIGILGATNTIDMSALNIAGSQSFIQSAFENPADALDQVVASVESMGPTGALYFGIAYTIAEVLAIPAIPLTASAGYLFGPVEGTGIVLCSASIAAAISFVIGRTLLRDYVEGVLADYPKFAKIDRAIGKEGFKLMLLLRLSPIFPFALSNYLYGASSINFNAFFWGTLLGFTPGTIAYVYTGFVGKALTGGPTDDITYPWFVYAGGLALFAGLLNVVADTATRLVEEMEDDED